MEVCGEGCQAAVQGPSWARHPLHHNNFHHQQRHEVHSRDNRGEWRCSQETHQQWQRRLLRRPADHESRGDLRELPFAVLRNELSTNEDFKADKHGHVHDSDDPIQDPEQDKQRDVQPGHRFGTDRRPSHHLQICRGFTLVMLARFVLAGFFVDILMGLHEREMKVLKLVQ
jgi:hypothetical protein